VALFINILDQMWSIVFLYSNQIKVHALIGQSAMAYCASKIMEKLHSSQSFYKSNRPHVSMGYRHDKPLGMLEEHSMNFKSLAHSS